MTRDVGRSVAGTLEVVDVVALGDTGPYAVAFGPAGDMWVTLVETGELLRRSPDGSERRFAIGARPGQLAVARDAVWCAVTGEDRIAVVAGDEISFVDAPGGPYGMAVAGDGVWTGLMQGDALARLGSRGPRLDVPLPVDGAFPAMIAVDEDDAVWVSLNQAGALARRSPQETSISSDCPWAPPPSASRRPQARCGRQTSREVGSCSSTRSVTSASSRSTRRADPMP